jgi:hypothetical protein
VNPELARQDDHADALRAGCSHSVHFLDRQRCSSASPWLCRRLDQRVVRLTNRLNSPAEPLTPRGNKPLNPRSPVPATLHCRWATLIRNSGLTNEQTESAIESEAFGPLAAELRRAEANHHDVDVLLPRLVAARGFGDADDIAAVLHYRVERATGRPAGSGRTCKPSRLIVGLLPRAHGVIDAEMRAALDEREALIEARAAAVLDGALTDNVPWTKALGAQPNDRRRAAAWCKSARVVAAYRDRYRITDDAPLGAPPESAAQKIDAARARSALTQATEVAGTRTGHSMHQPVEHRSPGRSL